MSVSIETIVLNIQKKKLVCFNNEMMYQVPIFKYLGGNNLVYNNYTLADQNNSNFAQMYNNLGILTITASLLEIQSPLIIKNNLSISGSLSVYNNVSVSGNLNCASNVSVNGNISFTGSILQNGYTLLPAGTILMWYGSEASVPSGWAICDGSTVLGFVTPDLRGRFVLGSGQGIGLTNRIAGETGGEETHLLTTNELPSHTHTGTTSTIGDHSHTIPTAGVDDNNFSNQPGQPPAADSFNNIRSIDSGLAGSHNHTFTTNSTGGDLAHNNMPPYYVLVYIMKCF